MVAGCDAHTATTPLIYATFKQATAPVSPEQIPSSRNAHPSSPTEEKHNTNNNAPQKNQKQAFSPNRALPPSKRHFSFQATSNFSLSKEQLFPINGHLPYFCQNAKLPHPKGNFAPPNRNASPLGHTQPSTEEFPPDAQLPYNLIGSPLAKARVPLSICCRKTRHQLPEKTVMIRTNPPRLLPAEQLLQLHTRMKHKLTTRTHIRFRQNTQN